MISRHARRILVSGLFILMIAPGIARAQTSNASPAKTERIPTAAAPTTTKFQAPAEFRWSGVYIGGSVGFGDGKGDTTFTPSDGVLTVNTVAPDARGFVYGFFGGVNFQRGIFVGGLEADVMFSHLDGAQSVTAITYNGQNLNGSLSAAQDINWYSTVRGRAGVGAGGFHVYGTAGVAIESLDHQSNATPLGASEFPVDQSDTKYGWAIGGGLEGRFSRLVTWRVQYLHLDFGDTSTTANPVPPGGSITVNHTWISTANVFTAGIGFKF